MGGHWSVSRRTQSAKSNEEFLFGLKASFSAAVNAHAHDHCQRSHSRSTSTSSHNTPRSCNTSTSRRSSPDPTSSLSYKEWTDQQGDRLEVPRRRHPPKGLQEERDSYEITVKLFFLPRDAGDTSSSPDRCAVAKEAVELVLKELQMPSIDLLIVSFPGLSFDADSNTTDEANADEEDMDSMVRTWSCFEALHDQKIISKLGVAEFDADRLSQFLQKVRTKPRVNQINVRDCCIVPKPLILFAKEQRIELLTHNDCTNILPRGTTRELLSSFNILDSSPSSGTPSDERLRGEVVPQWVVKYTAVVKNRGVIENKGYFAMASLQEPSS